MTQDVDEALAYAAKNELRKRLRAVRAALPDATRAKHSDAIAKRVIELLAERQATSLLAYVPLRSEVNCIPIVDAAHGKGIDILLPRVDDSGSQLELHGYTAGDTLVDSPLGVREPEANAPRVHPSDVSLALVPALAVDERGYRLGYGKGFYDRLLPHLGNALTCALVFDFQRLVELPVTTADQRVDVIVSEKCVHRALGAPTHDAP